MMEIQLQLEPWLEETFMISVVEKYCLMKLGIDMELVVGFGDNQAYNFGIKDATFTRLRELSVAYDVVHPAISAMGLNSVTLRWTGRNLWADYKELVGIDPSVNQSGVSSGFGLDYFTNPSTKSYLFSLTANF